MCLYIGQQLNLDYSGIGSSLGLRQYELSSGGFVNLKDGVALDNDEGSFIVKATDIVDNLANKDISECTALDANAVLNDPTFELPNADSMVGVSFTASDRPTVSGDPKVIDGVTQ